MQIEKFNLIKSDISNLRKKIKRLESSIKKYEVFKAYAIYAEIIDHLNNHNDFLQYRYHKYANWAIPEHLRRFESITIKENGKDG